MNKFIPKQISSDLCWPRQVGKAETAQYIRLHYGKRISKLEAVKRI